MNSEIQRIKQRFEIIGNSPALNRAIDIGLQVAPTDLSVLITGESGTGKEVFPQIIHLYSTRKHGSYIAVNCGAIPEGTIDSELFGHEKGAFTGAMDSRKGYFEEADGGTIFLDEVAELPVSTQVRLLRVLESGEFLRVGSSKVQKTDVRVIAATNVNIIEAIRSGDFREDLYYRLNTVPINILPLRQRTEDIPLLFRKFASDFAEKYRMPIISLDDDARRVLVSYKWPGNVRQLKNVTEQISVIEESRLVNADKLLHYLPDYSATKLPAIINKAGASEPSFANEREILYKILFDMRNDVNDLKKLVLDLMQSESHNVEVTRESAGILKNLYKDDTPHIKPPPKDDFETKSFAENNPHIQDTEEIIEESLSLVDKEIEMIKKALKKYNGKRRQAAEELGISERTLYRKIKEYSLD
ncbi:MAG: sigma-54 dependent transcriptional regulator [Bacteroidales bacterium]|nr:sigma-54 dependent transcriptional regulator [Bacteroidales bacterium]MDD4671775.1 sigma-54 dependent transcriptional regulator [Bacteroidales bacterium]MDY0347365.1 sigma-54 dependent transcriptional regulator [Tenuifilaceae bacterium]